MPRRGLVCIGRGLPFSSVGARCLLLLPWFLVSLPILLPLLPMHSLLLLLLRLITSQAVAAITSRPLSVVVVLLLHLLRIGADLD